MRIKGVIFDMDGLMLDTEKLLMKFWIMSANEFGFDMKKEHVLGIRSLAAKYAVPKLQGIFGESFDYFAIRKRRIELMNQYIKENGVEKKPGLDKLLKYLKANEYKIAVATATDEPRTEMYLKSVNVLDYFDVMVCGPMVENGKPAPDIYLKACELLNLEPSECIALEDSPNGILSAYRAGCKPIMIPDLSQPDKETSQILFKKLDSLDMVIDVLEKI
ncbi:HAD family hydrolase [Porcipelethomonas sp.]|uniref:HAD family hydrolase n=1 Tax=Porcipelethomonas sp. TaxID=2981675 RepID=UPI003EF2B971